MENIGMIPISKKVHVFLRHPVYVMSITVFITSDALIVLVVLLFYVHGKHLRSCQLT